MNPQNWLHALTSSSHSPARCSQHFLWEEKLSYCKSTHCDNKKINEQMKNNLDDVTRRIVHSDATTGENEGQMRVCLGSERWTKPPETWEHHSHCSTTTGQLHLTTADCHNWVNGASLQSGVKRACCGGACFAHVPLLNNKNSASCIRICLKVQTKKEKTKQNWGPALCSPLVFSLLYFFERC